MEAGLTVEDSFLTGSYARSTMIAPLKDADVDIFVVMDSSYFCNYEHGQNGGQAGLLDRVKAVLTRTYTRTPDISRNGQGALCRFPFLDEFPSLDRYTDCHPVRRCRCPGLLRFREQPCGGWNYFNNRFRYFRP